MGTEFHSWRPTLRADIYLRVEPAGDVVLLGPRGRFIGAFPSRWRALLGRMDGSRDVSAHLLDAAQEHGGFDPRGLVELLRRLSTLGALSGDIPRIPRGEASPTMLDRLLGTMGRILDINLTGPAPAPWDPKKWTIPAAGLLVLAAHVLMLFLFLHGIIESGDGAPLNPLTAAWAAFGGLAISMTLRGLVRWYVLFASGRPARRGGLRIRMGLPYLDVDPRAASDLSRTRQVALAISGAAALAVAGVAMLLLPGGGPLAAIAGQAAMLALALDLCPFARSDGSLLLEAVLGIQWLRGRTLRYLRAGLVSLLLRGRAVAREERRLLLVVIIWALWTAQVLPFMVFPAIRGALDVTGQLLTHALATDDAMRTILGLFIGLYLAVGFCVTSIFTVLLTSSFFLRSAQHLVTARDGKPADNDDEALGQALSSIGLDAMDSNEAALDGRWIRLVPGDRFPSGVRSFSGVALLVAGSADIRRSEISGLVHDIALAEPGWLIRGRSDEVPSWRWTMQSRSGALMLLLDADDGDLALLANRIAAYEDCPALWGLGPDGARWAASHPEVSVEDGDRVIHESNQFGVLLEGAVSHSSSDGGEELSAPCVLPGPGPGEELRSCGGARLLFLPSPGSATFLPWWWSVG